MSKNKRICEVCLKRKSLIVCEIKGKYYKKHICKHCINNLALQDDYWAAILKDYNNRCSSYVYYFLASSIVFLVAGLIAYSKVFSNLSDVKNIFTDNSKLIYFILFSVLNFASGGMVNFITRKMPKIAKVILNLFFTVELTLLGCVVIIKDDINWISKTNPIIYILSVLLVSYLIIFILNNIKKIDKGKLMLTTLILLLVTSGVCLSLYGLGNI